MTTFEKVSESTLRITRTYAAPRDLGVPSVDQS